MTVTIERVANGYIIRDDCEGETWVVANEDEYGAAQEMLREVNERIGRAWDSMAERMIVISRATCP